MENNMFDDIIVGAGIIGLSIGVEILKFDSSKNVLIIEKECDVGFGQTGNNSNVLHSGIYYKPGSLKSKLCIEGHKLWIKYCTERSIPITKTGKYIIATNSKEEEYISDLIYNAKNVDIPFREVEELELKNEGINGLKGIFVENTCSLDFRLALHSLKFDFIRMGGSILYEEKVKKINKGSVITESDKYFKSTKTIIAAGLGIDKIVSSEKYFNLGFNGYYYKTEKFRKSNVFVYPAPNPELPFLGVHSCRSTKITDYYGPNALPAFFKTPISKKPFFFRKGFYKLLFRLRKTGIDEILTSVFPFYFRKKINNLVRLGNRKITRGFVGTRAQCISSTGDLVDDFVIERNEELIVLRNVPSPAATSSLALAKYLYKNYYE